MNADHALVTGYSHRVCQDFVGSGLDTTGQPFVVLSDGCSGSPNTDTGSRLIVHSAIRFLKSYFPGWRIHENNYHDVVLVCAMDLAKRLELNATCCDATLLTLGLEGSNFICAMYGDGVFVGEHKENGLVIHEINFESDSVSHSYPNYPIYRIHRERFEGVKRAREEFNLRKILTSSTDVTGRTGEYPDFNITYFTDQASDWNWVGVLSDGIQTFRKPTGDLGQYEPVTTREALKKLCEFKNLKGQFVQRRLNRFLKEVEALEWKHEDDISFGVINLQ